MIPLLKLPDGVRQRTSAVPRGDAELLAAIDDPKHERYADLGDWIETEFDPVTPTLRRWLAKTTSLQRIGRKTPSKTTRAS